MKLVAAVLMLLTLGALGEVVVNFITCKQFFHDEKVPGFGNKRPRDPPDDARYVKICQKYKNQYRYATLYDTANKIPVYSAYKYERTKDVLRPDITWMIEPRIGNEKAGGEMTQQKQMKKSNRQAYNSDYEGSRYDRGHLYPHCHARDKETSESTFTLTNAAPQRCDFNKFWYDKVEAKMKKALTTTENAKKTRYVVTGVVPDTGSKPLTLKKDSQVNVPTHFWTAYCCCDTNKQCQFGGFILEREADEPDEFTTSDELNDKLSNLYTKPFKVFYSC